MDAERQEGNSLLERESNEPYTKDSVRGERKQCAVWRKTSGI